MNVTTMKDLLMDILPPEDSKRLWYPYRTYQGRLKKIEECRIICSHPTCMTGTPDHPEGMKRNNTRNGPEGI